MLGMKLYYTLVLQFSFLLSGEAQVDHCQTNQRKLASLGVCSDVESGDEPHCAALCTGEQIIGREECTKAKHCCFRMGKCVLKRITAPPLGIEEIQSLFPGVRLCSKFPESCSVTYSSPADLQPPLDIPYCRRISCRSDNPFLDHDPTKCLENPGCAFDHQLFIYRSVLSQAILLGVPVCHLVIRNEEFQSLAANYIQQTGKVWNPLLTNCFISHHHEKIFGESTGCGMTRTLGELGHQAKRAGWTGISKDHCLLINGCWINKICIYPLPLNNIKTQTVERYAPNNLFFSFGRHMCLPFKKNLTNGDFLDAYHSCLSSGCTIDVDRETLMRHIYGVTSSYLPQHLQPQYWTMALLGQVQAHNWKQVADQLIGDNTNSPTNILSEILPQNILGGATLHGGGVSVLPFTLAVNFNSSSVLGSSFTTFGSFGQFGNFRPPGSSLRARGFDPKARAANVANKLNLENFGSLINPRLAGRTTWKNLQEALVGSGPPAVDPHSELLTPPCPYQFIQWPGFPPLAGSFQDCCKRPMCYIPRIAVRNARSEVASYQTLWTSWGPCSSTCGIGQQIRRKFCVGDNCGDVKEETQPCSFKPCPPPIPSFPPPLPSFSPPLPPFSPPLPSFSPPFPSFPPPLPSLSVPSGRATYSPWSQYSECDKTCGGGNKIRTRICLIPGECNIPMTETAPCRTGRCPRFRRTAWSVCSKTCGTGRQQRRVSCVKPGFYGCPQNANSVEERECETFCGEVTYVRSACNQTSCLITSTPRCTAPDGGQGNCRKNLMKVKTKKCGQGRCFCQRNRRRCRTNG